MLSPSPQLGRRTWTLLPPPLHCSGKAQTGTGTGKERETGEMPGAKPGWPWHGSQPHRGLTLSHLGLGHPLTDHPAGVVHHGGGLELHRLHHIADADLQREGNHGGGWAVPTPASPAGGDRWVSSDCWPLRCTGSFLLLLLPSLRASAPRKPEPSFYWQARAAPRAGEPARGSHFPAPF